MLTLTNKFCFPKKKDRLGCCPERELGRMFDVVEERVSQMVRRRQEAVGRGLPGALGLPLRAGRLRSNAARHAGRKRVRRAGRRPQARIDGAILL